MGRSALTGAGTVTSCANTPTRNAKEVSVTTDLEIGGLSEQAAEQVKARAESPEFKSAMASNMKTEVAKVDGYSAIAASLTVAVTGVTATAQLVPLTTIAPAAFVSNAHSLYFATGLLALSS